MSVNHDGLTARPAVLQERKPQDFDRVKYLGSNPTIPFSDE
jgi:hypothetical protein